MKIYDFDVEDEIQKVENYLQNVEKIQNSFADYTSEYRDLSRSTNVEFNILSDCIKSYERALLISVYTYAEQLVRNFYYELLEKDRTQNVYNRNFVNKKLDIEKFSPNVKYAVLEYSIKSELCPDFKFIISKNREEIIKYDDIIKDRHRYAHRGIYQGSFEQYQDVINAEKYITNELVMIVEFGIAYRIQYQNDWKNIRVNLDGCIGLYQQYCNSKNLELKRKLIEKIKLLRRISKKFCDKYAEHINKSVLLEDIMTQLLRINTMDLRSTTSFFILKDLELAVNNAKLAVKQ